MMYILISDFISSKEGRRSSKYTEILSSHRLRKKLLVPPCSSLTQTRQSVPR